MNRLTFSVLLSLVAPRIAFGGSRACLLLLIVGTLAVQSCSPVLDPKPGTGSLGSLVPAGTALRYVALGNSLTAGFQSGAVVGSETQYAYPVLMAQQLGIPIGDGADQFQYMRFPDNGGIGGRNRIESFSPQGLPNIVGQLLTSAPSNATLSRPYNNLGIPGALLRDMNAPMNDPLYDARFLPQTAMNPLGNPFFPAVIRNTALGRTPVDQAVRLNPNLVTIWIGNNDVLGYAASGGTSGTNFVTRAMNPMAAPAPTEVNVFTAQFNTLMDDCVRRMPNAKFIVGNIPDVTAAPFFTTVGAPARASLRAALSNTAQVPAALAAFINQILPDFPNGLLVASSAAPGGLKPLNNNDLILLTAQAGIASYGPRILQALGAAAARVQMTPAMAQQIVQQTLAQTPIPNELVFDEAEQQVARAATTAFNQAIQAAVNRYSADNRAILFDANAIVERIRREGYPIQGQGLNPATGRVQSNVLTFTFISGGFFSLDGIHPSSRGYGAIANEMLKLINSRFGANIPLVNLVDIPALPVGQPVL
jgi:lysophospholipase L1-like esterase